MIALASRCITTPSRSAAGGRLTRARDWQQSASRALAAELLAPARALAVRLRGESGREFQSQLAEEFQVDAKVIARPLADHGLGGLSRA